LQNPPIAGFYYATANVKFYEYDIMNNDRANEVTESKTLIINLTPWYFIVIILLVLAGIIAYPIYTSYQNKKLRKTCKMYKVKKGATIMDVAAAHNINWKKLAKLNKLKKPYTLKEGQVLCAPALPEKDNPNKK
jgi:predicted negative regulator of RcsB-dependent stress response